MDENRLFSSRNTTIEDLLTLKKVDLVNCLRRRNQKISGTKHDLARRVLESTRIETAKCESLSTEIQEERVHDAEVPSICDLETGWDSNPSNLPVITVKDIENYLIHSSHRTTDSIKMECYRQYIRGLNFYKENYIHKVQINIVSDESEVCYIRSRCHPSMKKGSYTQWVLMTKKSPCTVVRASCTCPAGLGEGCSHISGLLFWIEGTNSSSKDPEGVPCTSKPCEWNKPSKRKTSPKKVENIKFKRIKLRDTEADSTNRQAPQSLNAETLNSFRNKLCSRLGNETNAVLFDLLPHNNNSVPVESDMNVVSEVTIETSENITYESDKYIDIMSTVKDNTMSSGEFVELMEDCDSSVVEELEMRTRGQSDNNLWVTSRKARLTASIFHDVLVKKKATDPKNLVDRIFGCNECETLNVAPLKWGKKNESVAKKRYIATKKLKFNEKVTIAENGLYICQKYGFLGASPDGVVVCETGKRLLEVKCPYRWRFKTVTEACSDPAFYCYLDADNQIQLKQSSRYYTQVQGQMGICSMETCDFVVYTKHDLKVITVTFDKEFWQKLLQRLVEFYKECVLPVLTKSSVGSVNQ